MKWINIHIPKCAGTTFTAILKANFGVGFGDGRGYLSDRNFKYTSSQVDQILHDFPNLTCFSDHKLSIDLPWEEFSICAIAFVRNPVDRYISHYSYCRTQAKSNIFFDQEAGTLELDDYITETLKKNPRKDLANGQCYHLFGGADNYNFSKLQNLLKSYRLILFPVESFEDACIYLEKRYPDVFKDTSHLLLNASLKHKSISCSQRQRILAKMEHDLELYSLSQQWFEEALSSIFQSDLALDSHRHDLAKRCESLSKALKSPLRQLRRNIVHKARLHDRAEYFRH